MSKKKSSQPIPHARMGTDPRTKVLAPEQAIRFLHDAGLMFEINRRVLHPLGLSLMFETSDDGSNSPAKLIDFRFDPIGGTFSEESFREATLRYQVYLKQYGGMAALESRLKSLGFIEQTVASQGAAEVALAP